MTTCTATEAAVRNNLKQLTKQDPAGLHGTLAAALSEILTRLEALEGSDSSEES